MAEAFKILTDSMVSKGNEELLAHGKFKMTFIEGADELKETTDFNAPDLNTALASKVRNVLADTVKPNTPSNIVPFMKEDKGPAFKLLVKAMKAKGSQQLYTKGKIKKTNGKAATDLEEAKGLESDHDDPNLSQEIHSRLSKLVEGQVPQDLKNDMTETLDITSKYLSQSAIDELERGPAFDLLIKELQRNGGDPFTPQFAPVSTKFAGSYVLKSAPGLSSIEPDATTAPIFLDVLHRSVDAATPKALTNDMNDIALQILLKMMKGNASKDLAQRNNYSTNYGTGAAETEAAPILIPFLPIKDIADEVKQKISPDAEKVTPPKLKIAMKGGAAGDRYPLNLLAAVKQSLGSRPLFKFKSFGQTYADAADVLKYAGPLESDPTQKSENLKAEIMTEMRRGTMDEAATHLAKIGMEKAPAEKRQILADLMTRQGDAVLGKEDIYKVTYTEGGQELMKAPVGVTNSVDDNKKQEISDKIATVIPDKKLEVQLKDSVQEGSAYITDILKGRDEVMKAIHDGMKSEKDKEFLNIGKFSKSHGETADMLSNASHFGGQNPSPVIVDKVAPLVNDIISAKQVSAKAKPYVTGGLDAKALAELDAGKARSQETKMEQIVSEGSRPENTETEKARLEREKSKTGTNADREIARSVVLEVDAEREQALKILHGQLKAKGGETFYKQPHNHLTHNQASEWLLMNPPMVVDRSVKESGDTSRYKALVRDALISGMQKRRNEILIEVNGAAETYFFAAQRLKKAQSLEVKDPSPNISYFLAKNLEEIIRCHSMARKLMAAMKDHIKEASDFLSVLVTKPDEQIEAYAALLNEMEAAGDTLLIETNIPKTYKDSADFLRHLTSYKDKYGRSDSSLQSSTEGKLKQLMAHVKSGGYSEAALNGTITESTKLLVSYIVLQGEKTEVLKEMIGHMDHVGGNVLLRHGKIRKTYSEGADLLRPKNADQLSVPGADPVVSRKIQIKLRNLMDKNPPKKHLELVDAVIEDATMFMAIHFLEPQIIQVCKCMKNVFVQCELWCDEILRRVAQPCCSCSRHVSNQALSDVAPGKKLQVCPGTSRAHESGINLNVSQCPHHMLQKSPCPAHKPTIDCGRSTTASYLLYSPTFSHFYPYKRDNVHTDDTVPITGESSLNPNLPSGSPSLTFPADLSSSKTTEIDTDSTLFSYHTPQSHTPVASKDESAGPLTQSSYAMFFETKPQRLSRIDYKGTSRHNEKISTRSYSSRTPIVTTDEMADWHAMMVSLIWNLQAWRDWIQDNINRALYYYQEQSRNSDEPEESWLTFQRRILSPTRSTVATDTYIECQQDTLHIIEMFNKWTQWITVLHFREKVQEHANDWAIYNTYLDECWQKKYEQIISAWKQPGPVWVVSACGAVPSGAVAAGVYEGEVMCNAEVSWVAWRAGDVSARTVRVASGVHVGRVHYRGSHLLGAVQAPAYRCHVLIYGRPFAFSCYDLLVLNEP
ncbi:unnamed protein product [Leptidea sinapis]|uniref:Uncharacterized protein n=1 Tax=Leptidea sinapis TaxID=189913 RepID=A0A5E4QEX8_9NEOP|nr:unnamed protein product [Leptidea sinapis]